ncbi:hypothetical protein [Desulfobacula phenolica]|uniref:Uncharacterized protein n=1 Tax=Desulfobacula phenolica TaxID=90732 RepID=A0A1H2KDR0_9BACT|nr:hypothetical protein [Desulfobacula phenolica]SDU66857.1 hypothetical protein SAMN04487931_1351 [Desulfobacula phenolica]
MNSNYKLKELGVDSAMRCVKAGDILGARSSIGISEKFADNEVIDSLIGLDKALYLFRNQKHLEANEYFQKAAPLIKTCKDQDSKLIILTMSNFAEGLAALFNGNAHLAANLLNVSSAVIDKMSFYIPEFKLIALSYKAASLIALSRASLNASDIASAENIMGKAKDVHDELLKNLDPDIDKHAIGFAEVYGTRCEIAFQFIAMIDLPSLDLIEWHNRLQHSRKDVELLKNYLSDIQEGPIQRLMSLYPSLYTIFDQLHHSVEIITLKKRPFRKEEVETLVNIDKELFKTRQIILKCGDRGKGLIFIIDQLVRLQKNLLKHGASVTRDFGKFSGIVSFVSMIILIFVLHITVGFSGYTGVLYFFGVIIISLIAGFGFGALRFRPLLKIFSEALNKQQNE